jgi:hypothetical protein
MRSVVRSWVPILLVSSALALVLAAPAKADGVIYTLDASLHVYSRGWLHSAQFR